MVKTKVILGGMYIKVILFYFGACIFNPGAPLGSYLTLPFIYSNQGKDFFTVQLYTVGPIYNSINTDNLQL